MRATALTQPGPVRRPGRAALRDPRRPVHSRKVPHTNWTEARGPVTSNSPVSMVTPGGTYYYHSDEAGNVADVTNASGTTQWAYQYEPFGLIRSATNVSGNAPTNPIQYASQYTDTATGLSNLRARQYDPNTGAFLSTDPLGENPNSPYSSAYEYAADLPLINSDPTGMSCLGFGSGSCGQDLSAAAGAVYHFVVQPFVQTAQDDWACVTGGTHCAAAALNTGLMLLPLEGLLSKDIALAAAEATRGALRDVATTLGGKITGGLYQFATEETGSFDLGAFSKAEAEGVNSAFAGAEKELINAADGSVTDAVGHSLPVADEAAKLPALTGEASQVSMDAAEEGAVVFRAPAGATADEIAQIKAYCQVCNEALNAGGLSPTGRVSTSGALRAEASRAAAVERAAAADRGEPYVGHVGHVPDTTWTGNPNPFAWMDLTPRVNSSLGGQASQYPVGFWPTGFFFGG